MKTNFGEELRGLGSGYDPGRSFHNALYRVGCQDELLCVDTNQLICNLIDTVIMIFSCRSTYSLEETSRRGLGLEKLICRNELVAHAAAS